MLKSGAMTGQKLLRRGWVAAMLLLSLGASAQQSVPVMVIDRVTIIDGTGTPTLEDGAIVVEGGRIRAIGRRDTIPRVPGATVIDATGKFVIPGLIDAHVHFDQSAGLFTRPDLVDLRSVRTYADEVERTRERLPQTLLRYLWSGVTAVVDMGGPMWTFDVRDSTRASLDAPRIVVAGPLISTEPDPELESADPPVIAVETAADARATVQRIAERGSDLIKILFLYHPFDDFDYYAELVEVVIAESHRLRLRAAVHATELATARAAVDAGADILVHSVEDQPVDDDFITTLKARDVLYIPTLLVTEGYDEVFGQRVNLSEIEQRVGDPDVIQSWGELAKIPPGSIPGGVPPATMLSFRPTEFFNLQRIYAAGVRIAAGSDAGNIGTLHGPALHREMELMVEAGMRPLDVVVAATRNAAAVMGKSEETGTLEEGKTADLVLLDADPTLDIRNTRKIFRVMKAGEWIADIP
jgi:imidazolonepropionase-like amidohydrolase